MTVLDDRTVADSAGTGTATPTRRPRRENLESERANRSRAAQRALDRRRNRVVAQGSTSTRGGLDSGARRGSLFSRARSVPFVVPVLALLVVGLGLSLWLSTKAAQDSYRLGIERKANQSLVDRRDSLKRSYESGDSAPELSDKAAKLGMIPVQNPARMVVGANGKPKVLGDPEPASGKPMGTINPDDKPDPTSKIDKSKVSDSMGLGGAAASDSNATPSTDPNSSASANSPAPNQIRLQGRTPRRPRTRVPTLPHAPMPRRREPPPRPIRMSHPRLRRMATRRAQIRREPARAVDN